MNTFKMAGFAAAVAFALSPAAILAQTGEGMSPTSAQSCQQALGADASILAAPAGTETCCFVAGENDWYLEKGVQLGGSYQGLGAATYTAVECPGEIPQSLGADVETEDFSVDDDGDDGDDTDAGDDDGDGNED